MRNCYTRPGGMFGRRNAGVFTRAGASAVAGPTVLLNAAYLTDTLLDDTASSISNGENVGSWAMATGGTYTRSSAVDAGASDWPVYVAASGVHTAGGLAALTCATPVTIPANADCVIYVKGNLQATSQLRALGKTNGYGRFEIGGDGDCLINLVIGASDSVTAYFAVAATGVKLYRCRRVSGVWSSVMTGETEIAMTATGTVTGALSFDTLLAFANSGAGLDSFSAPGDYLQKLYIYHGSSTPDTAYEIANGGTL